MSNYTLEIVSHHANFKNKSLKKYNIEGIESVGVWGNEPFEIRFKNHTYQKIQVKLTLDGTDILTGKPATTEVSGDMWVVQGYGTLSLKAWPETNNGGAQFVFTSAENSVAINTHGDLSSRGIIAAAVYTEGYVEPVRINYDYNFYYHPIGNLGSFDTINSCWNSNSADSTYGNSKGISNSVNSSDVRVKKESLVAVGAGQHVDQKITHAAGLIKPVFSETVRVRYLWWDDLVSKLKETNYPEPHASGFPGDGNKKNIDLGNTPRLGERPRTISSYVPMYLRF